MAQPPLHLIRAGERYHHRTDWLSTYWHFSFDHYHDPANVSFGPLRVFNDDTVEPKTGFPPHSHADMEIISWVLAGTLEHRDGTGNHAAIGPGELQVMSAGTGITHAEYNPSATERVHFLQIWIRPRQRGRVPRWAQQKVAAADRAGRLVAVVSGRDDGGLTIDQDATMYVGTLAAGQTASQALAAGRRAYLFVIEGRLRLNGNELAAGDQARISGLTDLELGAVTPTELLLLDLP
jgi:redox-sensitive bicupin YhaK (pirin superfamily)